MAAAYLLHQLWLNSKLDPMIATLEQMAREMGRAAPQGKDRRRQTTANAGWLRARLCWCWPAWRWG
ncbi:MAG: hypothetical protein WDN76_02555 [Alphaproteobacteria bacterium]